jgi:hypothetical protein
MKRIGKVTFVTNLTPAREIFIKAYRPSCFSPTSISGGGSVRIANRAASAWLATPCKRTKFYSSACLCQRTTVTVAVRASVSTQAMARDPCDFRRRFTHRHQPDDLPLTALHASAGAPIALLDFFHTQVLGHPQSSHSLTIYQESV